MDNKKRTRNLLLYLAIPIILIIIAAVFLSTRSSESPKTSELVQYFVDDKVDSYVINYGTGAIEITLKEGEKAYPKKEGDNPSQSLNLLGSVTDGNAAPKSKTVVKGQLADIRLFLEEIKEKATPSEPVDYNLVRASDNSFLIELIPTLILVAIFAPLIAIVCSPASVLAPLSVTSLTLWFGARPSSSAVFVIV